MANFEAIALHKLLTGDLSLIQDLSKTYFSGKYAKLYTLTLEHYSTYSELPTPDILKASINSKAPVSVRGGFIALVDAITNTDVDVQNDILVKSLQDAHVLRGVDAKIEELLEAQRNKDAEQVKGILSTLLESIAVSNVEIDDFMDAIDKDDHFSVCPSGLGEDYDELIGGGFSGLTLVTAKSGAGKSIMLLQSAIESYKAGKNVLYISLELSGKVLGNRVKSYLSDINFGKINSGKCTKDELAHIDKAMTDTFNSSNENVWRVTTSPVDVDELMNIIKVEMQLHDIDVVVIDYLALVAPSKYDRGESWMTMANLAKSLHRLTMQDDVVVITASQINEVKKSKDGVEPELTTRGTKELEFSSTQFFYLEKVESDDPESFPLTMFQMKNRLAKKVHSILDGQFSTMKTIDTGVRLN